MGLSWTHMVILGIQLLIALGVIAVVVYVIRKLQKIEEAVSKRSGDTRDANRINKDR
jgi:uncharacterized protein YoxC